MEHEVKLGNVGEFDIEIKEGNVKVSIGATVPGGVGIKGGAFVEVTGEELVTKIFDEIKKKTPDNIDPGVETVKQMLIMAIKAIK